MAALLLSVDRPPTRLRRDTTRLRRDTPLRGNGEDSGHKGSPSLARNWPEVQSWPTLLGIFFAVNFFSNLAAGSSLPVSAGYALAITLEPALCAWLVFCLARSGKPPVDRVGALVDLTRLREVISLAAAVLLAVPAVALLGALLPNLAFGMDYFWAW